MPLVRHTTRRSPASAALLAFVERELVGDYLWLARTLLLHGPECGWPIELRVERELKGWDDCRGVAGAFELLAARCVGGRRAGTLRSQGSSRRRANEQQAGMRWTASLQWC